MVTDRTPVPFDGEPWGFDNGAFLCWRRGRAFDGDAFLRRVERAQGIPPPFLAVTPDIVGEGMRSLLFSLRWRDRLPEEWPWFLAVQDGMRTQAVSEALPRFAGLFLGGTDRFKGTAAVWCRIAHEQGKRFHYGRAGTLHRLDHAVAIGADSLDSAFPLWTRRRWETFVRRWQYGEQAQLSLPLEGGRDDE